MQCVQISVNLCLHITSKCLQTLVDLGLLTEAELEAAIVTEFNPIRVGFKGGKVRCVFYSQPWVPVRVLFEMYSSIACLCIVLLPHGRLQT